MADASRRRRGLAPIWESVLPAGWTVRRAAPEAGATLAADHCTACCAGDRRRRATDQQSQRSVVRALLLALGQVARTDCAKQRPAVGIHHRHNHLRPARHVKHDSIQSGPGGADPYELTYRGHLSRPSLLWASIPRGASTTPTVVVARLSDGDSPRPLSRGCQRSRWRVTIAPAGRSGKCPLGRSGRADDRPRSSRRRPWIAAGHARPPQSAGPQTC